MAPQNLPAGTRLGTYEIEAILGIGGMGVVYKARDLTLGRAVALKVMTEGVSDPRAFQRFEREARAAAQLTHPNLAVVHFVSLDPRQPFVALELLPGGSLADRLKREGAIPWREAARLGAQVARALAVVHGAGFVHRDLKPANVLLDNSGVPKLTDFGLVRRVAEEGASQGLTKTGELLGTLEYVAPEQVDGARGVDGRADLYSLGATLYALVTGAPPFDGTGYALVKKHLQDRPRSPRERTPDLPPRFDSLILRLLAKTPEERPESASLVAGELEAIALSTGKLGAPPRRRGLVLALVALGALGSVALVGTSAYLLGRSAALAGPVAPSPSPIAVSRVVPSPSPTGLRSLPGPFREEWRALGLGARPLTAVFGEPGFRHSDIISCVALAPDGKSAFTASSAGVRRTDLATGEDIWATIHERARRPYAVASSGEQVAVATEAGVELLAASSGRLSTTIALGDAILAVAFAPSGARIATGGRSGRACLLDSNGTSGPRLLEPTFSRPIWSVAFSPGGGQVAAASGSGEVRVWDVASGALRATFGPFGGESVSVVFLDEDHVAANQENDVVLWETSSSRPVWRGTGHMAPVWGLARGEDGTTLFSASIDGTVRRWRTRGGSEGDVLPGTHGPIRSVAVLPGGREVVTAGAGVAILSVEEGTSRGGTRGHQWLVTAIAPLPKDRVATGGIDGTVRVWDGAPGTEPRTVALERPVTALIASPDGKVLWAGEGTGTVARIDVATLAFERLAQFQAAKSVRGLALLPRGLGTRLLVAHQEGRITVVDSRTGQALVETRSPSLSLQGNVQELTHLALLPGGDFAMTMTTLEPQPWRIADGCSPLPRPEDIHSPRHHGVTGMALIPGSDLFVSGGIGGQVIVWEWKNGQVRATGRRFQDHESGTSVWGIAASPDGRRVASGGQDGRVNLWDVRELISEAGSPDPIDLRGVGERACSEAFSADSTSLYVGTASGLVLRFDVSRSR